MNRSDEIRLKHISQAANDIYVFSQNKTFDNLVEDRMYALSVIKCLEIIGEAASKTTLETREMYPQLPWQEMISMRNRLIHGYYDINLKIIWKTVQNDIEPLYEDVKKILEK